MHCLLCVCTLMLHIHNGITQSNWYFNSTALPLTQSPIEGRFHLFLISFNYKRAKRWRKVDTTTTRRK
jgi:hypothetical protein